MGDSLPMGSPNILVSLLILIVCIVVVAFFSSSEASLISVSKIRIRHLAEKGNKAAQAAQRIVGNHDKLFGTILLTENAFIILASSIGTALALSLVGTNEESIIVSTLVMTVLIVMFGEITPKTFAAQHSERYSLLVARPVELIIRLLSPVIYVFTIVPNFIVNLVGGRLRYISPFVTRAELKMQIDEGLKDGTVEEIEHELLDNVFKFGERHVNEVMVPRTEMVGIESDATFGDFLEIYAESPHAFMPVFEESMDNITGILSSRDVFVALAKGSLDRSDPIKSLVKSGYFVPETKHIGELFTEMQAEHVQMSIIIDEFSGTAGLVTLKELAAEIVGSLGDSGEGESVRIQTSDGRSFDVDASLRIEEVNDELSLEIPTGDYETVAGFVLSELGHIPGEGEQFSHGNLRFTVTGMHGVKIEKVLIAKG